MPNYTATKAHFRAAAAVASPPPFYLVPSQRYRYEHPDGTGYPDSPFASIWFLHFGVAHGAAILDAWAAELRRPVGKGAMPPPLLLLRSVDELAAQGKVSAAQRPSSKQRKRLQKRAAAEAAAAGLAASAALPLAAGAPPSGLSRTSPASQAPPAAVRTSQAAPQRDLPAARPPVKAQALAPPAKSAHGSGPAKRHPGEGLPGLPRASVPRREKIKQPRQTDQHAVDLSWVVQG